MYWSVASFMPSDLISSTVRCPVGLKVVVCEWEWMSLKKNPALKSIVAPSSGILIDTVSTKILAKLDGSVFQERFTHIKEQLAIITQQEYYITVSAKAKAVDNVHCFAFGYCLIHKLLTRLSNHVYIVRSSYVT